MSGTTVVEPQDEEAVSRVVEILVGAFNGDPLWSWAFPDDARRADQHRALWRLFVDGATRYPTVWLDAERAAAAVWIPPGGTELSASQEELLGPLLDRLCGSDAWRVHALMDLFEQAHPRDEPHYYLSLLGTDPAARGRGLGLRLLADNLAEVDRAGLPAYLEASNGANVPLYARYGFETVGEFPTPDGGPVMTTMWRPAQ